MSQVRLSKHSAIFPRDYEPPAVLRALMPIPRHSRRLRAWVFALPMSRIRMWMVAHYFRDIVESMERRKYERLLPQVHPEASLRMFQLADHEGPEGWKAAIEDWRNMFPGFVLRLDEYVDPGGAHVVLVTRNEVKGTESGAALAGTTALVLAIDEGMAVRGRYFNSKTEALEAVGLRE